jgi:hypothetical protein
MKITTWVEVRRYLKRTSLLFLLVALASVWFSIKVSNDLMTVRQQLLTEQDILAKVEQDLSTKQGKIDGLVSSIARQDVEIKADTVTISVWRQKLYNLELARDIVAYMQKESFNLPVGKASFNSIYLTIFYAQKYEKIYQKKIPSLAQFINWKTCVQIGWMESQFNMGAHGYSSELGQFQALEYDNFRLKNGKVNPKKTFLLYPTLCKLGYKKSSYQATIGAFLLSQEEEVDVFYYEFTNKLKDTGGVFTSAVVAYNGKKADPENSKYWISYLNAQHKFGIWYDDVETKLR